MLMHHYLKCTAHLDFMCKILFLNSQFEELDEIVTAINMNCLQLELV